MWRDDATLDTCDGREATNKTGTMIERRPSGEETPSARRPEKRRGRTGYDKTTQTDCKSRITRKRSTAEIIGGHWQFSYRIAMGRTTDTKHTMNLKTIIDGRRTVPEWRCNGTWKTIIFEFDWFGHPKFVFFFLKMYKSTIIFRRYVMRTSA